MPTVVVGGGRVGGEIEETELRVGAHHRPDSDLAGDAPGIATHLISKPPPASVAARVMERIAASAKTFTVCLVGGGDLQVPGNAAMAVTLKEAGISANQKNQPTIAPLAVFC